LIEERTGRRLPVRLVDCKKDESALRNLKRFVEYGSVPGRSVVDEPRKVLDRLDDLIEVALCR